MIEPGQNIMTPCYAAMQVGYVAPVVQTNPLQIFYESSPQPLVLQTPQIIVLSGSNFLSVDQEPIGLETSSQFSSSTVELVSSVGKSDMPCENLQTAVSEHLQTQYIGELSSQRIGELSACSDNIGTDNVEKMNETCEESDLLLRTPEQSKSSIVSAKNSTENDFPHIKIEKSDDCFVKCAEESVLSVSTATNTAEFSEVLEIETPGTSHPSECETCCVKFTTPTELAKHICTKKNRYTCEMCLKKFIDIFTLNKHMTTHFTESLECVVCSKKFTHKSSLMEHMQAQECKMCLKFIMECELSSHMCDGISLESQWDGVELVQNEVSSIAGEKPHCELFKNSSQERDLVTSEVVECDKSFQGLEESSIVAGCSDVTYKTEKLDDCVDMYNNSEPVMMFKTEPNEDQSEGNKCKTCLKIFTTENELSEHVSTHGGATLYTCRTCFKQFHENIQLTAHISTHASDAAKNNLHVDLQEKKSNKCEKCSRMFMTTWEFLTHMRNHAILDSHQGRKEYQLQDSPQTPASVRFTYSKQSVLECSQYSGSTGREVDSTSVLDTNMELCPIKRIAKGLSVSFVDQKSEGTLKKASESMEELTQSSCVSGNLLMTCKVEVPDVEDESLKVQVPCGEDDSLKVEELSKFINGDVFSCNTCPMKFTTAVEFSRHLSTHSSRKFVCSVCFKKFPDRYKLNRHMNTHTRQKMECKICSKKFRRTDTLTRHLQLHEKEMVHECEKCHEKFKEKQELSSHMHNHEALEWDQCVICSQRFPKGQFAIHMLTHATGEFWECPLCGKSCKKKITLWWHLQSCREEKKLHECDKRLKSFRTRLYLRKHLFTDKNDTTYDCIRSSITVQSDLNSEFGSNDYGLLQPVEKLQHIAEKMSNETPVAGHVSRTTPIENSSPGKKLHMCEVCLQKFSTREELSIHKLACKYLLTDKNDVSYDCFRNGVANSELGGNDSEPLQPVQKLQHIDEKMSNETPGENYCASCISVTNPTENETRYVKFATPTVLAKPICTDKNSQTCEMCLKKFVGVFTLNKHMTTHFTESLECVVCSKKFTQKSSLMEHMQAQECKMCLKFIMECELSSHMCDGISLELQQDGVELVQNEVSSIAGEKPHCELFKNSSQEMDLVTSEVVEYDESFQSSAESSSVTECSLVTCKSEKPDDHTNMYNNSEPVMVFKTEPNEYQSEGNECKTCLKIFATKNELSEHVSTCSCTKSYPCLKQFDENLQVTAHINTDESDAAKNNFHVDLQEKKSNTCEKCSRTFLTTWEFLTHMRNHAIVDSHQGRKEYQFQDSPQTGASARFTYSKQSVLESSQYLASTGREVDSTSVLHGNMEPFPVERIAKGVSLSFVEQKSEGILKKAREAMEELTQSGCASGNLLMTCKVEEPDVEDESLKVEELAKFINEDVFCCNSCPMKFATVVEFSRHLSTHSSKKFLTCSVCFKKFSDRYKLNRHMNTHTREKMECKICSKKFQRKDMLMRHLQLHEKEMVHECEKCHEKFKEKQELLFHMDRHEALDSDQCVVCSQAFPKGQFAIHMLTHVTGKFWECPLCEKSYKKKRTLLWHLQSCHEEGKPHECEKCLKSFVTRLDLRKHLLTDKNDASYDCVSSNTVRNNLNSESGSSDSEPMQLVEKLQHVDEKISSETPGEYSVASYVSLTTPTENTSGDKELHAREACSQTFSTREEPPTCTLVHTPRPYTCKVCAREFTQGSHLSRHMLVHGGEKSFECEICSDKFARKENLTRHLLNHVGERPHKCEVCSKRFIMKCDLTMHMLVHTGEKSHVCTFCPKKFSRRSHLSRHMLTHTGEKPHACGVCPEKFARKTDLTMHEATHKGEKADECEVCHKKFARRDNLAKHMLTHKGLKPHKCKICSWKFARKYNLAKHMLTHSGVREHECEVCAKKFVTKSNLFIHLLTHTREKLFECEICSKKFTTKSNVKIHMLLHKESVELECEVCMKKFRNKYRLARHLNVTHLGANKKYSCEVCMKKFSSKFLVQRHMLSHTGEKSHECEICSKRFGQKETLTRHMLIHSGEKPHQCSICSKKFTQRMALSKHLLIHTGELPYECDYCPKKFTHRNYLSRHLLTHTEGGADEEAEEMEEDVV